MYVLGESTPTMTSRSHAHQLREGNLARRELTIKGWLPTKSVFPIGPAVKLCASSLRPAIGHCPCRVVCNWPNGIVHCYCLRQIPNGGRLNQVGELVLMLWDPTKTRCRDVA